MNTVWLIVAVAFAIGELMTPSLTLVWFSIGALVLMVLRNEHLYQPSFGIYQVS